MAPQDKKKARAADRPESKKVAKKNPFVYILTILFLVISIAAFIWVPMNRRSGGVGGSFIFGSYAGKEIDYKPGNFLARMVSRISQDENKNPSDSTEGVYYKAYRVWRRAFEETVIHTALLHDAQRAGNDVSEARLAQEIMNREEFKDEKGKFSLELFHSVSEAERAKLKDSIKESLLIDDYLKGLSDFAEAPAERDFIKAMDSPKRSFTYAAFPFQDYPDSEIVAFGKAMPALFKNIRVSYLRSENSKPALEKIRSQLMAGKTTFEALLAVESPDYGGADSVIREAWDLNEYFKDSKAVDTIMGLAAGSYTDIMKAPGKGWIFYYGVEPAKEPDFADQDTVSRAWGYIRTHEKGKIEEYALKRAGEFAAKAKAVGFDKACAEFKVQAKVAKDIAINFGSNPLLSQPDLKSAPELADAMTNETLLAKAFSLSDKAISDPVALGEYAIVLRKDGENVSSESASFMIDYYYGYFKQQYFEGEIRKAYLRSPLFKDGFADEFDRFMPQGNG
jgi:peptidyl-prolyl cis-trans isomerase D